MALLEINNVSKFYDNHNALQNVSLSVPEGSVYGLLGPNGAGKTTLIRIINQISTLDTGTVSFDNQLLNPKHIYNIGYLPEERGLYKKQKVGDQMVYFGQLKGLSTAEAKLRTEHWLHKFDLKFWKNKKVEELSKGMQQKVQFIITVLHRPRLLILDEPFTGFDPINAEIIKNEIRTLKDNGTTILYSTHRMESVEEICDHICLLNKSKKILDGSVKALKLAHSKNLLELVYDGQLPEWIEALSHEQTEGEQYKVVFSAQGKDRSEIIKRLANEVNIWSFRELVPTIHQLFIDKVEEVNRA